MTTTPPEVPPPVGPRGLALRCASQGAEAYANGVPVLACPYGPARPFSRRAWLVGYVGAMHRAGARTPAEVAEEVSDDVAPWPGDTPEG